jgi:phage I-like protein
VDRESAAQYYEDGDTPMVILSVKSVALTNQPNLRVASLNTRSDEPARDDDTMKLDNIAKALNLAADADEGAIIKAVEALSAKPAEVVQPDLNAFVPRSDYDALKLRVDTAEAQAKADKEAAHASAVESAITEALKAGKVTPAAEAYHRAACSTPGGLAAFRAFVAASPAVVANTAIVPAVDPADKGLPLTEQQKSVAKQLNLSEADYAAELQSVRQNPNRMRADASDKE